MTEYLGFMTEYLDLDGIFWLFWLKILALLTEYFTIFEY